MPKLKSKKSCTKRIKLNKNGVAKYGVPLKRHGMINRSKRRLKKHGTQIASKAMLKTLKRVYPYSSF